MVHDAEIQIDLVKLQSGDRLLRLTDLPSGLVLEKALDGSVPLIAQKKKLVSVFEAARVQARAITA